MPAFAEVIVGEGNEPGQTDVAEICGYFAWGKVVAVDETTAIVALDIANKIGPEGPYIDGCDALIAAVGFELDVPVVSSDWDVLHPETRNVLTVEDC